MITADAEVFENVEVFGDGGFLENVLVLFLLGSLLPVLSMKFASESRFLYSNPSFHACMICFCKEFR